MQTHLVRERRSDRWTSGRTTDVSVAAGGAEHHIRRARRDEGSQDGIAFTRIHRDKRRWTALELRLPQEDSKTAARVDRSGFCATPSAPRTSSGIHQARAIDRWRWRPTGGCRCYPYGSMSHARRGSRPFLIVAAAASAPPVHGGLYASHWPGSLAQAKDADNDVAVHLDYRQVLAEALVKRMGPLDPTTVYEPIEKAIRGCGGPSRPISSLRVPQRTGSSPADSRLDLGRDGLASHPKRFFNGLLWQLRRLRPDRSVRLTDQVVTAMSRMASRRTRTRARPWSSAAS